MEFRIFSHRYASTILNNESEFEDTWNEIVQCIESITDELIINTFQTKFTNNKSLSTTINYLLHEEFLRLGWYPESPIFQNPEFNTQTWRLDFAKKNISIEVGFNHASVIAWNLLKPVIAGELNHVQKAIQTKIGVVICATESLRRSGGFDNSIGTFEKYISHLIPLQSQLSIPTLIIGLESPQTFKIEHFPNPTNPRSKLGRVVSIPKF